MPKRSTPQTLEPSALPQAAQARYAVVDALRGAAMVWMTVFHFCFDLQHFGYLQADFYRDPVWTWQRTAIVSMFIACAGVGQAIAIAQVQSAARFWHRWRHIAAGAMLVTVGSYLMYPQSYIYFGILHGIACMLVVLRFFAPTGRWLWWVGAAAIMLGNIGSMLHPGWPGWSVLNSPWLNWIGLINQKPITEDYAPILPWIGVMCWGMAFGRWVLQHRPHWLQRPAHGIAKPLAQLGRWSLSYYLLHQPVLIGLLTLAVWVGL